MASKIKVDQIEGSSGSTITIPSGQSFVLTDGLPSTSLPTVPVTKGGTGLTSLGSAGQIIKVNTGGSALEFGNTAPGIISSGSATDTTSRSTTSTTYTKASNTLDLTVTPASTSSKFLITFTGNFGNNSTHLRSYLTIFRDSTNLAPNGDKFVTHEQGSSGFQGEQPCTIVYLDSPNTTSQITYSFQIYTQNGSTAYIGGEQTGNTHYLEF